MAPVPCPPPLCRAGECTLLCIAPTVSYYSISYQKRAGECTLLCIAPTVSYYSILYQKSRSFPPSNSSFLRAFTICLLPLSLVPSVLSNAARPLLSPRPSRSPQELISQLVMLRAPGCKLLSLPLRTASFSVPSSPSPRTAPTHLVRGWGIQLRDCPHFHSCGFLSTLASASPACCFS